MIVPPLFILYLILLGVCAVTGIICTMRLQWNFSPIKLLPWFILLTLISELTALWCAMKFGNNHKVYNVYQIVQFSFFSFILTRMIGNKWVRKLLIGLSISFALFAVLNIAFIQGMARFNTVNFFSSAVIVSFFSGYALNELFKRFVQESPIRMPYFWVAGSMLMLNTCMIPLILPATLGMRFTSSEARIWHALLMSVNYISYTLFIIAFLTSYKNNKRSSL